MQNQAKPLRNDREQATAPLIIKLNKTEDYITDTDESLENRWGDAILMNDSRMIGS